MRQEEQSWFHMDLRKSEMTFSTFMTCTAFKKKTSQKRCKQRSGGLEEAVKMHKRTVIQRWAWAFLLWPFLFTKCVPLDCQDCPSISQEKLLDRVIQHAELIYRVSEESCTLFEEMFVPFPLRLQRNQAGYACITKDLPIPSSKSEIQQISDQWLLHSVLLLVQSWIEPLVYLQTTLDRYVNAPESLLNKTKWLSEKLLSLEQGVLVLFTKMLNEGMVSTTYSEHGVFQYDMQLEMLESIMKDYTLFNCFKKDAHKIETFLKLLKCRQTDKYNCA